ncbi:hypothetical protein [Candidatus Williamhamiltonella defendens]|uniref:hypothetical protein n=1 Tax=Candidatus Williamhamiltonella defendens TaxID=138072 RepID=UPI001581F82E|nr:hypothetical protein [Candidatus Hamiltonella defensa]
MNLSKAQNQIPALGQFQKLLTNFEPEVDRLAAVGDIPLGKVALPAKTLHKMGARVEGKPFSMKHLAKGNLAQILRFDASKLAQYIQKADYSDVITQQAVRFLKQQPEFKRNRADLLAGGDTATQKAAVHQLNAIDQHVQRISPMESTLDIQPALWRELKSVPVTDRWAGLNRVGGRVGLGGMQGYVYLRGLRDIKRAIERLQKHDLSQEEKKE